MARSVDPRLDAIQGKPLAMRGESTVKKLDDAARFVGSLFGNAVRHADLTKEEAGGLIGYGDGSYLARWISGVEVPIFLARFLANPQLRRGFVIALAEVKGDAVRVSTVVEIDHPEKEAAS
jgi:hypothetical protein